MTKIILQKKASGENHSIEAGIADNIRNFDHHGEFSIYPSPCNNPAIKPVVDNSIIEITHIDADTLVGIMRLLERNLPLIDLTLMEKIDLNGSSICVNKFDPTLLYMVGVGELSRSIRFPRCSEEVQDVTDYVDQLLNLSTDEIINIGRQATEKSESSYHNCMTKSQKDVGLWVIGPEDPFDPSRPYEDGINVVVVYRSHYKSISIYCNPVSQYEFAGKTISKILFAGHPKACGSPRGEEMSETQAEEVFSALASE